LKDQFRKPGLTSGHETAGAVIRFRIGRFGQFDVTRPTLLEIAALIVVLVFLAVLLAIWQ